MPHVGYEWKCVLGIVNEIESLIMEAIAAVVLAVDLNLSDNYGRRSNIMKTFCTALSLQIANGGIVAID